MAVDRDLTRGPFSELVDEIAARAGGRTAPLLVGIGGAVSVGKTTLAGDLAAAVTAEGASVDALSADAFLRSNAELSDAGLLMRKGFPETFDLDALAGALRALRAGKSVDVPVYSHDVYDRVEGATAAVTPAEVVIVEGVIALHPDVAGLLDVTVYVHAEEADVVGWFVERFLRLCAAADAGTGAPFYRMFAGMSPDERRDMASATWARVNGVNLAEHIGPSVANADLVLVKDARHGFVDLRRQARSRG